MLFNEDLPIKLTEQGVLLYVKATPNASSNKIGKIIDHHLKIFVTSSPENGQANKHIIKLLSEQLRISKNLISIIQGLTAQNKVILIKEDKELVVKSLKVIL
jgi:uncharacterized protein (TIGR00251 family)